MEIQEQMDDDTSSFSSDDEVLKYQELLAHIETYREHDNYDNFVKLVFT